jgi:MoaA/NifB/PqqE/SkfB family radical SAM enzyme
MGIHAAVVRGLRPLLSGRPEIKRRLAELDARLTSVRHSAASTFPALIRPEPRLLTVAITAECNLRCEGCRYGRDFMPHSQLPLPIVMDLLEDARHAGFERVRLYGGEPLLHKDLPAMIRRTLDLGMRASVTTNGLLLGRRMDELYDAGLRVLTIGFYGTGGDYDSYVGRPKSFARLEESVAAVRKRYGNSVYLQINFLLARPTCNLESVRAAWEFATHYHMHFQVDLVHYSLPYFTEGEDRCLQFVPGDRDALEAVSAELLRYKAEAPARYPESVASIRSIPDWALKGPAMRVPCTAYRLVWVGADGSVQLCYVTFKLGNLHEKRLRDMLFNATHRQAARDAFALHCPNCHCERDDRIRADAASRRLYGIAPAKAVAGGRC